MHTRSYSVGIPRALALGFRPFNRLQILLRCLLVLLAWAGGPCVFAQGSPLEHKISAFSLPNGITVILVNKPTPIVTCVTYLRVGAADDPEARHGVAHMLEHLAFKGTKSIGSRNPDREESALRELDRSYDALESARGHLGNGVPAAERRFQLAQVHADNLADTDALGRLLELVGARSNNAQTTHDSTVYSIRVPIEALELWFYLESDRFRHPAVRHFFTERDVVKEERLLLERRTLYLPLEVLKKEAYTNHPYRESVIGSETDLQHMTRADTVRFLTTYYRPRNTIFVLVGAVSVSAARSLAGKYFGALSNGPLSVDKTTQRSSLGTVRAGRDATITRSPERCVVVAFHKQITPFKGETAYAVLESLLNDGSHGFLRDTLVVQERLVSTLSTASSFPGRRYTGLFVVAAVPSNRVTNRQLIQRLLDDLERFARSSPSHQALNDAKRRLRNAIYSRCDDAFQLAQYLASYQALTGDWKHFVEMLDEIDRVTPEAVTTLAASTFVADSAITISSESAAP